MGRQNYADASGISHRGISKYPVIITSVKAARLGRLVREVRQHADIFLVDFPEQMLHTAHDDELTEAISITTEVEMKYLGAILYGDAEALSSLTGKFSLWK